MISIWPNGIRRIASATPVFVWLLSSTPAAATLDLNSLSIEELAQLEVTSVTKSARPLSEAPAAIYLITQDDIARSGASTLPEILRLAPNLQVAQITASRYAISARGFNGPAADKLLVLIDGRSIYTPFSSGVNWDLHEVLPDDIERIEVVSGPGGTLWGANAVNGVINIITRAAGDTQGIAAEAGGGNREIRGSIRYGGRIGEQLHYRAYVSGFDHKRQNRTGTGTGARDRWQKIQGGFRADWENGNDLITVQGDIYDGSEQQLTTVDEDISGHNLLARWNRALGDGSSLEVQAYYDHLRARVPGRLENRLSVYDLQAQHNLSLGRHELVWGGGYRASHDDFPTILSASQMVAFIPQSRTLTQWNLFVQDSFPLTNDLKLIAGVKIEREPYTGIDIMPNARISWAIGDTDMLWFAASRAVRVPSRLDRDVTQRVGPILAIDRGTMQPVRVTAYELGYRAQPAANLSFSISTFYNVYPNLRSAEPTNGGFPLRFGNGMKGETYGIEFWANYAIRDWWRLTAGANWLHKELRFKPGSPGVGGLQIAGNDPKYQLSLRTTIDLRPDVALSFDVRRVGALPAPPSPAYTELGARIGWTVSENLELSLTGANLLHAYHAEFGTTQNTLQVGPVGVRIGRSVFAAIRWTL